MSGFQRRRLSLGAKELRHSLLIEQRKSIIHGVEYIRAGDAVRPWLIQCWCCEKGCRGVRHLGRPFRLRFGGEIIQSDLGKRIGVSGDTIALIIS